jgi:hypothetical protein
MRLAKLAEDYFKRARIRIKSAELPFLKNPILM